MPPPPPTARRRPSFARRLALATAVVAGVLSAGSRPARAASSDEDKDNLYDARAEGYQPNAEAKSSSAGGAWMLLVLSGVACVGVMFIDAKRSHLD